MVFAFGAHFARAVHAVKANAQALLFAKTLAYIGMGLQIAIRHPGGGQLSNRLAQRTLGDHVHRTGHAALGCHAREQYVGATHDFDALKHFNRHGVGGGNAVQAVGGNVHGIHIQTAQIEVLQQVALVGGEDHRGIVLQHVLQGQGRPVFGQLTRIGIHMHGCIHGGSGAQNTQTCALGSLAAGGQGRQVFAFVLVTHLDGGQGGCVFSTWRRRSLCVYACGEAGGNDC